MRLQSLAKVQLSSCSLAAVLSACLCGDSPAGPAEDAKVILDAAGVRGGLVVHVECGDGQLTAALRADDRYLVHGLDTDRAAVAQARRQISARKLHGTVAVDTFDGRHLPYVDNSVNLVVLAHADMKVPRSEIERILAPRGVCIVDPASGTRSPQWQKPVPKEIDEWTHALHGPDNNAVALDTVVAPPRHLQWTCGPKWARSHDHLASVSVVVSSSGRIFSIIDEGPIADVALPSRWMLVARDAFSGVLLWKREVGPWENQLRGFRSGPPDLQRRLVAVGDHVYATLGYGKPVVALDALTGNTLRTYAGTDGALEIVCHAGKLYVVATAATESESAYEPLKTMTNWLCYPQYVTVEPPKRLIALDAQSGRITWRKNDAQTVTLMPSALAVDGESVYIENADAVVCLHGSDGSVLWQTPRPISTSRLGWSTPTLVVHGDAVYSADRGVSPIPDTQTVEDAPAGRVQWTVSSKGGLAPQGELIAFSAKTGQELWRSPCRETYNHPVDVLIADELLWSGNLVRATEPGITAGRDLLTGEIKRERPPDKTFFTVGMGHHRCHRNKATSRYLVMGRAGVELIDVATGKGVADHWVRGGCQYGVVPCNGLIYAPQHSCACYITSKLNGFNALAGARADSHETDSTGIRLVKGPAYNQVQAGQSETQKPEDWPTYRGNAARTGCANASIPAKVSPAWRASIGGKLTSPVIGRGIVVVASIDDHTVHALDAETGDALWTHTVGGRVDSAPTLNGNCLLFGSADGLVYCLRVTDGALAWRFRAAPIDMRLVAHEQVESVWPVTGSVLVDSNVVSFVAGRSSFLDGGMLFYRLDAWTGEVLGVTRLDERDPVTGTEPQDGIRGTGTSLGMLPDVLSLQGGSVYLRHVRFNREGVRQQSDQDHLYCSVGFLDDTWWHRTYWQWGRSMGMGYGGWPRVGNTVPAGRILSVDTDVVYGFGRNKYASHGAHVGLGGTTYRLFAAAKHQPRTATRAKDKKRVVPLVAHRWTRTVPLLVRAMVLTGPTLFIAGPPETKGADKTVSALDNESPGILWSVSAQNGDRLAELRLNSPPVFDGMAAAQGSLFVSTVDGHVIRLVPLKLE